MSFVFLQSAFVVSVVAAAEAAWLVDVFDFVPAMLDIVWLLVRSLYKRYIEFIWGYIVVPKIYMNVSFSRSRRPKIPLAARRS